MKRLISILLLAFIALPMNAKALSVSENNLSIKAKENKIIELYANTEEEIKEVRFTLVYTSYDIPGYFNIETGLNNTGTGNNHKIVFPKPVSGKIKLGTVKVNVVDSPKVTASTINIHSAKAITSEETEIALKNQIINVTVEKTQNTNTTTEEKDEPTVVEQDNNKSENTEKKEQLLEKIESSIVNIDLEENVYEYSVKIKEDIEELDLKPITKDEKYKVEISTQKIAELENNQIIITVKNGENKEEYKIKVNIAKNVEIDNKKFKPTFKYKGKWTIFAIIFSVVLFVGLILTKKQK